MEVTNDNPVPVSVTNVVYLDGEQFTQLIEQGNAMQSNQSYIFVALAIIIGVLLMQSFWSGWRSGK
ncbi:hypothetical protein NST74_29885 [Paenibacillus sp. FSL F4-0125]|uniref:hypothetical protein n=1 Tax=Paenibacillus sp. FSL F4-0125 TaxID=2954730 RepID=UPI0030F8046A